MQLNYHHLHYFWTVAHAGSVSAAAARLGVAQPTVSAQLAALEGALGEPLFRRDGRRLALTDAGRHVLGFADQIFSLGRDLVATLAAGRAARPVRFEVGVADEMHKLLAYRLLAPVLRLAAPVHFVCREDRSERLLAELSVAGLDLVLADAPASAAVRVRVYNHVLGESGVTFCAAPPLAARLGRGFPESLDGAPVLLPLEGSQLRRALDAWFEARGLRPRVVGEFQDSATLKVFGQGGHGVFAVPAVVADNVARLYRVRAVGHVEEVRERFYAISRERRVRSDAIAAIIAAARDLLRSDPAQH